VAIEADVVVAQHQCGCGPVQSRKAQPSLHTKVTAGEQSAGIEEVPKAGAFQEPCSAVPWVASLTSADRFAGSDK
jgi:hypothetical protein